MRILPYLLATTSGSAITTIINSNSLSNGIVCAWIACVVTVATWYVAALIPQRRKPEDWEWMARGQCPVCYRVGNLSEVTSTTEGSVVECTSCQERFDIRRSENGPIVLRVGTSDD